MGTTGGSTEFTLTSPAFADDGTCSTDTPDNCELFPTENVFAGDNLSPELTWTAGPAGTLSYVVVLYDVTMNYTHWVLWNLSAETLSLPAGLPGDATLTTPVEGQQANAPFGTADGYVGPGSCMNVYEFKVYALDTETFTPGNTAMLNGVRDQLEESESVLGSATLLGRANPDAC